jgi:hypothetical protein
MYINNRKTTNEGDIMEDSKKKLTTFIFVLPDDGSGKSFDERYREGQEIKAREWRARIGGLNTSIYKVAGLAECNVATLSRFLNGGKSGINLKIIMKIEDVLTQMERERDE